MPTPNDTNPTPEDVMIPTLVERARGCGYRKPGGLYLVSAELHGGCGRLPCPVTCCASCGRGIHPARGWTWVIPEDILDATPCRFAGTTNCHTACAMSPTGDLFKAERAGLLWVGESFYPTAESFLNEARERGVSRRVNTVPRGFAVGSTWVLVAHRKAIRVPCGTCCAITPGLFGPTVPPPNPTCDDCNGSGWEWKPGIIAAFKSEAVQYVVRGSETHEELERMRARGLTPVRVMHDRGPDGGGLVHAGLSTD